MFNDLYFILTYLLILSDNVISLVEIHSLILNYSFITLIYCFIFHYYKLKTLYSILLLFMIFKHILKTKLPNRILSLGSKC